MIANCIFSNLILFLLSNPEYYYLTQHAAYCMQEQTILKVVAEFIKILCIYNRNSLYALNV